MYQLFTSLNLWQKFVEGWMVRVGGVQSKMLGWVIMWYLPGFSDDRRPIPSKSDEKQGTKHDHVTSCKRNHKKTTTTKHKNMLHQSH